MSSRSSRRSAAVRPHEKFAELKALRQAGKTRLSAYEVEEEEQIYDELDDESYRKRMREKMLEDDFVVDDRGEGYVDNGEEDDWDRPGRRGYYSDEEESDEGTKGSGKLTGMNLRLITLLEATDSLSVWGISKKKETARGRKKAEEGGTRG